MGTLGIIREMLVYIQGESHPIYLAEQREGVSLPHFDLGRWWNWLFLPLLLLVPVLTLFEQLFGIRLSAYRDIFIVVVLAVAGSLLSVGWTLLSCVLSSLTRDTGCRQGG